MDIIAKKIIPIDFSEDVLETFEALSFTKLKHLMLVGSASLKSQIYAGDYDMIENVKVKNIHTTAKQFQDVIKKLMNLKLCYIGDIKLGSIEEWKVISDDTIIKNGFVHNYKPQEIRENLKRLRENRDISPKEYEHSLSLVKNHITTLQFLEIKRDLRFHIIRWTPKEILKGYKILHNGKKYTIVEALKSSTITKLDAIRWVNGNHFTDFSIIYAFYDKFGANINEPPSDIIYSLKENIYQLYHEHNYFKMAKRMFALSRAMGYNNTIKILNNLFNSDLGRLYSVYGDLGTLEFMIENYNTLPKEKISFEIDQFINRLSNITLPNYLEQEKKVSSLLHKLKNPQNYTENNAQFLRLVRTAREYMNKLLSHYTYMALEDNSLIPIPKTFLP